MALKRAGHDVHVVAAGESSTQYGVHVVGLPSPRDRSRRMLLTSSQLFLQAARMDVDAYHVHEPEFLPWALLLRARRSKPVVYDSHEYYREALLGRRWLPSAMRAPVANITGWLEPRMASHLDAVVTADEGQQGAFWSAGAKRVILVRNLPPRDLFDAADPPLTGLPRRLFHIGSLSDVRGWSQVTAVADSLATRGVEVVIVGMRPSGAVPWHARFTGHLSLPEIVRITRGGGIGLSALLLTPQNLLGVPMKVFEYMALGLPLVASDIPPHRYMVAKYAIGRLYPPADHRACLAEVLWLLSHTDAALDMSRRGRKAYLEGLNFDLEGSKLNTLYEEILHVSPV